MDWTQEKQGGVAGIVGASCLAYSSYCFMFDAWPLAYADSNKKPIDAEGEEEEGSPAAEEEQEEEEGEERVVSERKKWNFEPKKGEYMAIFLNEESREKLKARFPKVHENELYDHMTIVFEPSKDEVLDHDDLLTENYEIHVLGHAVDDFAQTLYCIAESPHVESRNRYAHITLSVKPGYEAKYSNTLMCRIAAEPPAKEIFFLKKGINYPEKIEWSGVLPEAGIYPESKASYQNVEHEQITVTGTYCLKSAFDGENRTCNYVRENECAFCKFMKGGPCRKEFIAWEKCIGVTKSSDDDGPTDDFVDRCASHTIVLKNCVDSHPDYYSFLADDKDEKEEQETEQENP